MMVETSFERDGVYTPLTSEAAFLAEVATASGHMTVETVGTSTVDGWPLRKVTIDAGHPGSPVVMVVGGVHGSEPAGREAALTFIRDAALSEDPAWVRLRETFRIVSIPTANPTGLDRGTKACWLTDTQQLDLHSDQYQLRLNESTVVQEAIGEHAPVFLIDCHEYWNYGDKGWLTLRPNMINPHLADSSMRLYQHLTSHLTAVGVTHGLYDQNIGPQYRNIRHIAAMRHTTTFLVETAVNAPNGDGGRLADYRAMFDGLVEWVCDHVAELCAGREDSRRAVVRAVQSREGALDLRTGVVLDSWPLGYAGLSVWPPSFDVYGVEGDTDWVPLDQDAGLLLTRMLDPDAHEQQATATRVNPSAGSRPWGRVRVQEGEVVRAVVDDKDVVVGA